MTWMTMLTSEAWESTLVMRTLQSWKSSSFILSLIAWRWSQTAYLMWTVLRCFLPSGQRRPGPCQSRFRTRTGSACCSIAELKSANLSKQSTIFMHLT